MSPEANEAPINHIKITNAMRNAVIEKLLDKMAIGETTALEKEDIKIVGLDDFILKELVLEGQIKQIVEGEKVKYYLSEEFKPMKSYRREVVMGLSIPLLIFLVLLILAGFIAIIWQLINLLF